MNTDLLPAKAVTLSALRFVFFFFTPWQRTLGAEQEKQRGSLNSLIQPDLSASCTASVAALSGRLAHQGLPIDSLARDPC